MRRLICWLFGHRKAWLYRPWAAQIEWSCGRCRARIISRIYNCSFDVGVARAAAMGPGGLIPELDDLSPLFSALKPTIDLEAFR